MQAFEQVDYLRSLLAEFDIISRTVERNDSYVVYIKEAEKISDFLKILNSFNSVLYYEDIRIYRDHKNMVNRLNNCEIANQEKILKTGMKQLDDIRYLKENDLFLVF